MKRDWLWVALIVSVLLNVFTWKIGCSRKSYDMIGDTIYLHDTTRIVEPRYIYQEVVRYDTVFFPIVEELDSIGKVAESEENSLGKVEKDSAKVVIPITERTYEDSTYKAVVRGYNPELVSLDIYNSTKYYPVVEKVKVKPKIVVSAGLYGGFGSKGADYGLGIMVGVPIWSW